MSVNEAKINNIVQLDLILQAISSLLLINE